MFQAQSKGTSNVFMLLFRQCSFLVVLNVTNIENEGKNHIVRGSIKHLLGFEDESTILKNYASFIRN